MITLVLAVFLWQRTILLQSWPLCWHFFFTCMWSTISENSERETQVQPEGQKSKTVSHWLLSLLQSKMVILPPGISEWDCVWAVSPIIYSSPGLGWKVCSTTTWFLWQASVVPVTGNTGASHCGHLRCVITAWFVRLTNVAILLFWSSGKFYLLKYK